MGEIIGGRYELLDPVASGATGAVWRAGDHRSGMLCAAKVMRQRDSADMMRFVREKSIRLRHRHLLTPDGFVADDDHVVIGMPLASGGTLADVLSTSGGLSDQLASLILGQLLEALDCLHSQGWIHRDVKPGNLLFEPVGAGEPIVRLADFGIAVHESDVRLTATGFVNGTPGYISPEVSSTGDVSPAQDLWAAGVVAIAMISPATKVSDQGCHDPQVLTVLEGASSILREAILSLLDLDPASRMPQLGAGAAALVEHGRAAGASRDRRGHPVVFHDHLPALPEGSPWGGSPVALADSQDTVRTPLPRDPRTMVPASAPATAQPPEPLPERAIDRGRRRPLLLALAAVVLLASAIPATFAVRGSLLEPEPSEIVRRDASISVGGACGWMDEGTSATAAGGADVVCTAQDDGAYRWERS